MNITVLTHNTIAIAEFVFFILTIYHLVTGLKTKDYDGLMKYGAMYLILNLIRRIREYAQKKAMAVSIIGGADGPTSIFLAGKVGGNLSSIIYLLSLLIILLGVGILIYIRKKK